MLMYDYKNGMQRCIFIDIEDPTFTCEDCAFFNTKCDGEFYNKYGIHRRVSSGFNRRSKD